MDLLHRPAVSENDAMHCTHFLYPLANQILESSLRIRGITARASAVLGQVIAIPLRGPACPSFGQLVLPRLLKRKLSVLRDRSQA